MSRPTPLDLAVADLGITVTVAADHGWQHERQSGAARSWRHRRYDLVVHFPGGDVPATWRQGEGVQREPDERPADVVHALVSDARAGAESFRDFCNEFGYTDGDGHPADHHETWQQCREVRDRLLRAGVDLDALGDLEH